MSTPKSNDLKSKIIFESVVTLFKIGYEVVKYFLRKRKIKQSHDLKMEEAGLKKNSKDENIDNNRFESDFKEEDKYEWEDLSDVVNDSDACQQIEYFPGTPVHKGDLCCIYSPTGQGKSTLVMQMLIAMASGKNAGIVKDNQPDYKSQYGIFI